MMVVFREGAPDKGLGAGSFPFHDSGEGSYFILFRRAGAEVSPCCVFGSFNFGF